MKNYIQRIIRLFATSDPDPKLTGEIHRSGACRGKGDGTARFMERNGRKGGQDYLGFSCIGIYQSRSQLRGQTSATYPFRTLCGCHSVADRISFGHFSNDQTALCRSSPY